MTSWVSSAQATAELSRLVTTDDLPGDGWSAIDERAWRTRARRLRVAADDEDGLVQFSRDLRDGVADGTITVSYRLWARPQVKLGSTYWAADVEIEIDEIDLVPFSSVTDEDLAGTGEPDLGSLRRRAAHAGPVHDDTLVYRLEFHVVSSPRGGQGR